MKHCLNYWAGVVVLMVGLSACGSSSTTGSATSTAKTDPAQVSAASPLDGEYVFDTAAFRKTLDDDASLKNVPPDLLENMLKKFELFKVEVKGAEVEVVFGNDKIHGKLDSKTEADGETRFKMTPTDPAHAADFASFVFKGNTLTIEPGKSDEDKLYFVKK